jgi:lactate dehydrogenase-like 2-hydroxyacid dehydrogenase
MNVAMLVNRENFETYSGPVPEGWELVHLGNGEPDADKIRAVQADVLVVDAIMKVGPEIIEAVPNLKLIHSQGVAYNGIDLQAAKNAGVFVCNNAGVNAQAGREQRILLILARCAFPDVSRTWSTRDARWRRKTACFKNGLRSSGRAVGHCRLGAIGPATAARLKAFGQPLHYYSRTEKRKPP